MNATETDTRTRVTVRPERFLTALGGRSVRHLADAAGLPRSSVGVLVAYANGARRPEPWYGTTTLDRARKIARSLGRDVGAVFAHPNGDPLEGEQA